MGVGLEESCFNISIKKNIKSFKSIKFIFIGIRIVLGYDNLIRKNGIILYVNIIFINFWENNFYEYGGYDL